ncbi:hypothetical protein D3C87_1894580 [compost metagenome]
MAIEGWDAHGGDVGKRLNGDRLIKVAPHPGYRFSYLRQAAFLPNKLPEHATVPTLQQAIQQFSLPRSCQCWDIFGGIH